MLAVTTGTNPLLNPRNTSHICSSAVPDKLDSQFKTGPEGMCLYSSGVCVSVGERERESSNM